ncbi:sunset domain-containing protein [Bacillus sp. AFS002410]
MYHVPGRQYYNSTKVEVMFCTEEDTEKEVFVEV